MTVRSLFLVESHTASRSKIGVVVPFLQPTKTRHTVLLVYPGRGAKPRTFLFLFHEEGSSLMCSDEERSSLMCSDGF